MACLLAAWIVSAKADMTPSFSLLYSFTGGADGGGPYANLIQAADGSLYGTTWEGGGSSESGTIVKISPEGLLTTLYQLLSVPGVVNDGDHSQAPLVQGADGNFYGTASSGGEYNGGTVFKITPSGTFTSIYSFANAADGRAPLGGLVQGRDGSFYGMTFGGAGGQANYGTVFKISSEGMLTTLHTFVGGADGANPALTSLVQGRDGVFYGTTTGGGANDCGVVFKITPNGDLTVIHTFNYDDGATPYGGLVMGSDGNFYGTTLTGGNGGGTVFRVTPQGELTTLYTFTAAEDGSAPVGKLIQGTDGNFYGTTTDPWHFGTVFKITPSGTLTTLHAFNGEDGQAPYAGLVEGLDGSLYGMTNAGGTYNKGTVFRLDGVIDSRGLGALSPMLLALFFGLGSLRFYLSASRCD